MAASEESEGGMVAMAKMAEIRTAAKTMKISKCENGGVKEENE
jgi:hypothetical protein